MSCQISDRKFLHIVYIWEGEGGLEGWRREGDKEIPPPCQEKVWNEMSAES